MHCEKQGTVFLAGGSGRGLGRIVVVGLRAREGSGLPTRASLPMLPAQKRDRGHPG